MFRQQLHPTRDAGCLTIDESSPKAYVFVLLACLACLLSIGFFFRAFLTSHFDFICGNLGDNRFNLAILEHWWAVVHGAAPFRSPNFYWPEPGALGYSDSLFLLVPPYVAARIIGLDSYLAFEVTLIFLKIAGFFSMLWLLRSFVRLSRSVAIVSSTLFTVSNLYFISGGHAQLMAVIFVPLLVCLLCAAWRECVPGRKRWAFTYAALFGVLWALLFFTSFYSGWFTLLAGVILIFFVGLGGVIRGRSVSPFGAWASAVSSRVQVFAVAALSFGIAIIPFLLTYLPTLKKTGGRSFQENLLYCPSLLDLINIGSENWIWGRSLNSLLITLGHAPMVSAEAQRGWPPFCLLLLSAALVLVFVGRKKLKSTDLERASGSYGNLFLAAALSASLLLGYLLTVKFGGHSLWLLIFDFFPGGSAIRVPARFNLVLNVFLVIVVGIVLEEINLHRGRIGRVLFWSSSVLLLAEQINTEPNHLLRRSEENALLQRVQRAPSTCASFFLEHASEPQRSFFAFQIDAMLVARMSGIPTVNGYSGWVPPGWEFLDPSVNYIAGVRHWVNSKQIQTGFCGLDLRDGSWRPVNFKEPAYVLGSTIDFRGNGNAPLYEAEGWGEPEEGGTWAVGGSSVLVLKPAVHPPDDLLLVVKGHAFVPPQHPRFEQTLLLNGSKVAEWSITNQTPLIERRIRLPRALMQSDSLRLEFINHDPKSPKELGLSADNRKLGLAVETLSVLPIESHADSLPPIHK